MVKNSIGGNKAKKQGRKHITAAVHENKLRISVEEGELYAIVLKIYGNTCKVLGINAKEYLCHIRNKFSGRSKRDNLIVVGSWVLVGLRDWESETRKSCDLLEIYSSFDVERLKSRVYENWTIFSAYDGVCGGAAGGGGGAAAGGGDDIVFTDKEELELELLPLPQRLPAGNINDDFVDIDDI